MSCAPGPSGRPTRSQALVAEHRLPLLSSIAYCDFAQYMQAGVLARLWRALAMYDALKGLEWTWQSVDGAIPKASVGRSHGQYGVSHLGLRVFTHWLRSGRGLRVFTHWLRSGRGISCAMWLISPLATDSQRVAQ